ncbi:hypothetical protein LBW60_14730 [Ralstonia solanacearum]|uniref:DUF6708 domain-containing protein n=1 Tax=Ralstonia solanacearum TaxID=305 RepID=UPI001FF895B9|nr:DUF6708 domain-containing protein [Ralstonia solanacearum]MDB0509886.1 hypothetical protein [Ralstonia solanacearum]MDB0514579.1 hypothetical protein [Ralstonia solanacearum]
MTSEYDDGADDPREKGVLVPVWNKPEPYFQILDKLRPIVPPSKNPWRVVPDDKRAQTHRLARTRECLVAVHPKAIVIGSPYGRDRRGGLGWFGVIFMACVSFVFASNGFGAIFSEDRDLIFAAFALVFSFLFMLIAVAFFNYAKRMPSDWPIMFNRENRTVAIIRPARPRFFKFWKFTDLGVFTYAWDDVRVRSYKAIVSNAGKSFHESYYLVMLWGGEDESGRKVAKECIPVGYFGYFEDERLFQVWEHIRRYMEEGGPPIQPGERLRKPVNNRKPMEFPPEVIAAAGGPALSVAEVERLAGVAPEGWREASSVESG